ncbi:D-2-hydroxyacid dehydrogenase [Halobacteriales archaeon QS_3_64_16]|nr:MAG: D-2-hydroxyacid dehydrogenase [Halobacteriales archaeon QS_3_64_16]
MTRRVGIHESVSELFPPAWFEEAFGGSEPTEKSGGKREIEIADVGGDLDALSGLEVCVTLACEEAFLESDLSWVHSVQAGVDRFPLDAFDEQGIALTNSEGIHGDVVGETVLGYLLTVARGLHRYRDAQGERRWSDPDWSALGTLNGERICVIGLGTLGQGVARRAEAFGMEVVGVRRTPTPVDGVREVYTPANLERAIEDSRFVVLCVPLIEETQELIGPEELAAMEKDAFLVNVARGAVVEERALVDALEAGEIAGAALDVFESEPLPEGSPLWEMEEVVISPHVAAAHEGYADRVAAIVRENLQRQERGKSFANRVV